MRERKKPPKQVPHSFYLRVEQIASLGNLAKRQDVSMSLLVREAIDDYMAREAEQEPAEAAVAS